VSATVKTVSAGTKTLSATAKTVSAEVSLLLQLKRYLRIIGDYAG